MNQSTRSIPDRQPDETASTTVWARPVIPLSLSFIAGILAGEKLPGHGLLLFLPAFFFFFVTIFQLVRKKSALFSPLLLFLCLGYLSIQPWTSPRFPENHIVHYADGRKRAIQGVIESEPVYKNYRLKFHLQSEAFIRGDHAEAVTGKLGVTVSGKFPDISPGDRICFAAGIRSIRNFGNPGGFDYERFMAFKGIHATTYTQGEKIRVLAKKDFSKKPFSLHRFRKKISGVIDDSIPGRHRQIFKALVLGDRSGIPDDLRETFNRTGTGHLLAISGLHVGIIASISFFIFSWILSRFEHLLWHARVKKGAALLSIFPILFYGLLSGMSPSTQRAVIMVSLFLMTFPVEREQDMVNTIAIAAFFILLVFPPALFSISFQLSFSAVLSIVLGLSKIRPFIQHPETRIPRVVQKILLFIAVSFFATAGTMPVVMAAFNQISLIGLPANLVAVPLIGFMVVPVGLLSIFLWPLNHFVSIICIKTSGYLLSAAVEMMQAASDMPYAAVKTITPSVFEIICFYLLLWGILNLGKSRGSRMEKAVSPVAGTAKIIPLAACILLSLDAGYWFHHRFLHNELRVTLLDVGQGNAALLELPKGYCMLIDGGGFSSNAAFDVGKLIVAPFLWGKKIRTVETLVLSHPNSDHMNGLIYIAKHFNVKNLWSNHEPYHTQSYAEFIRIIREKGVDHPLFSEIPRRQTINGVDFHILYPKKDFRSKNDPTGDINNHSLVVRAVFRSVSFLFPGDILADGERELAAEHGKELNSSILLAPHHGSRTSNTGEFLREVCPETIVISAGWKNRFNLPNPEVVNRYESLGARIYQTGLHGAVSINTDGHWTRITTGR
ncbi:MAG: DNA internalization-related competence protein ComEC/Rec2 [Desulfobacterales bacterium]